MRGKKKHKVTHHAHRYEQFDEAFLRYLARYLPGFKQQPMDVRLALCGMIYEAPTRYRAHSHHEGVVSENGKNRTLSRLHRSSRSVFA